jgi:hypothetical protein
MKGAAGLDEPPVGRTDPEAGPPFVSDGDRPALNARRRRRVTWTASVVGAATAAGLLYCFSPETHSFYPRCALHWLTGLQCPGCGGLRAAHHLLHGEVAAAFRCNPFLISLLPVLAALLLVGFLRRNARRSWAEPLQHPLWLWLLTGAAILFGVLRNLPFGPFAAAGS